MAALRPSGEANVRVCASMIVLVTIALILRMLAKLGSKTGIFIEDWLICLSTCLFYVYSGLLLESVLGPDAGGSSVILELNLSQLDHFFKYLYIEEIVFVLSITATKLSILYFYMHIFAIQTFRRFVLALVIFCVLWAVMCLFFVIFQCRPIHAGWKFSLQLLGKAKCFSPVKLVFGFEVVNVLLDVFILCLPIYMIKQLQLPTRRKLIVGSIFLMGGFVCVTCIVRMYFIYDPKTQQAVSLPGATDWATIELATAIVCGCLPTYGPLIKLALALSGKAKSLCNSLLGNLSTLRGSKKLSYTEHHDSASSKHLQDDPCSNQMTRRENTEASRTREVHPMDTIHVQNIVEVV